MIKSEKQVFLIFFSFVYKSSNKPNFLVCVLWIFLNEDKFLVRNMRKSGFMPLGTWLYKENQKILTIYSRSDSKCISSSTFHPFAEALCISKTKRFQVVAK